MKKLIGYFVRGALVLAPLAATVFVLVKIFTFIDGIIPSIIPLKIPGLGFLIAMLLVILVGMLTSNVVGKSALEITERVFQRLPLVKLVYNSVKDLLDAFVGDRRRFDRPVAVTISETSPIKLLGFITRDHLGALDAQGYVAVYLPTAYNFAGNLILVPSRLVQPVNVPSGDLMTFIISGGVTGLGVGQSLPPPPPSASSKEAPTS
jgi:uncharacterized membrane protein